MRDVILPTALLAASLGFAIAHQTVRQAATAMMLVAAVAVPVSAVVLPDDFAAPSIIACTLLTLVFVAAVYADRPFPRWARIGAAALAGAVIGALASFGGRPIALVIALLCILVFVPASWLACTHRPIVNKIVVSWILAVSILSLGLAFTQGVNAGTDHLD